MQTTHQTWLTSTQVSQLHTQYGYNKLPEQKPPTQLQILLSQLKSPLIYVLLIAAIVTAILWEYEDTIIIIVSVILNTLLWRYQESKANQSLQALKQLLQPTVIVVRDSSNQEIPTSDLVPWDIVYCKAGIKIPADGIVVEQMKLSISEAMLTGESLPINKNINDSISMGTVVVSGSGYMQVTTIGADTQLGKIASEVQTPNELTPLQKQLEYFSKQLTWIVLGIVIIVVAVGLIRGTPWVEIFTTAVALAVGAIPEWLLIALTVVLAVGMHRILHRRWLVKSLVSAETLGWVTVICSDKTGTLTQGIMSVVSVVGDEANLHDHITRTLNDDNAVSQALTSWIGSETTIGRPDDILPFSSEHKYTASLYDDTIYVTGAPEYLMSWSTLTDDQKADIHTQIEDLTSKWYRLVACASTKQNSRVSSWQGGDAEAEGVPEDGKTRGGLSRSQIENANSLSRQWLICLADPIRPDVADALALTHQAGIKLIVITGDYVGTARAIIQQLGITLQESDIMTWDQLTAMSESDLDQWLENNSHVKLFARTKPEQKMRIVQALKDDGEIVAMTWDGINDAPALKHADIGIVVWSATDVAKESADLILLDSSFSTVVAAVQEGRGMFDNIRKVVLYLMCDAFEEIIVIILCLLIGMPLPVTAAQILWINLISDWLPGLALTIDPHRTWLMSDRPRHPSEHIINPWIKRLIIIVSVTGAVLCFAIFSRVLHLSNHNMELARSVAFITLGVNSLVYVFSVKTLYHPVWKENVFNNHRLLLAVLGWLVVQFVPFVIPWLGNFLDVVRIWQYWWMPWAASAVMFAVIEIYKFGTKKL